MGCRARVLSPSRRGWVTVAHVPYQGGGIQMFGCVATHLPREASTATTVVSTLPEMGAVDAYFATLDDAARSAYERIRELALAEVPRAEQGVSYGMAALKYEGKPLLGFRAAKEHLSVFPFSPAAVEAVKGRLRSDGVSKGTVRFTPDHPLPDSIVVDLVRSRVAEIDRAR